MTQWIRHMPLVWETGVRIHCETPMCPWARHLTPSCSRGVQPLTYIAIVMPSSHYMILKRRAELCGSHYMTCSQSNQECSSFWAVHTTQHNVIDSRFYRVYKPRFVTKNHVIWQTGNDAKQHVRKYPAKKNTTREYGRQTETSAAHCLRDDLRGIAQK